MLDSKNEHHDDIECTIAHYCTAQGGVPTIAIRVCLSVCLSTFLFVFSVDAWFGLVLTTMQYVMYFRFYG